MNWYLSRKPPILPGGPPPGPSSPSLIQMVSAAGNPVGTTYNDFFFTPPNSIGAGNCLVIAINARCGNGSSPTGTISDNKSNSWGAAAVTQVGDFNATGMIFVLPNAISGTTRFKIHFNLDVDINQFEFYEWNNIATSSPVNGTHAAAASVTGPNLACGSFTPGNNDANGGNLILAFFACCAGTNNAQPTNWVPGGSFTLLQGNTWAVAGNQLIKGSMYFLQTSSAAINPSITSTGDSADTFNCLAVALKTAPTATGTPIPAGIHVNKLLQYFAGTQASLATGHMRLPATGNLRILLSSGEGLDGPAVVTDNEGGGTWASVVFGNAMCAYSPNKSPNQALAVTITANGGGNGVWKFFDVQGAAVAPFDVSATETDSNDNVSTINNAPTITPTTSNGLVVAAHALGIGPGLALAAGSPAGAVWLDTDYTGKIDGDNYDSGDCYGMYYNPNTSTINWCWTVTNQVGSGGDAVTVAFKAA